MRGLQRRFSAEGSGLQRRILLLLPTASGRRSKKLADCLVNNGRPQPSREFLLQIPCRCSKRDWGARLQVVARSAYPTPIAAPSGIGVSGAGEFARGIGQKGGNHMSVMASPSGQQIDIAASVRAAYQFAGDNARLAVNLPLAPFAILVRAELLALLHGCSGRLRVSVATLYLADG